MGDNNNEARKNHTTNAENFIGVRVEPEVKTRLRNYIKKMGALRVRERHIVEASIDLFMEKYPTMEDYINYLRESAPSEGNEAA